MTFSPTRSGTERILLWLALIVIIIYGVRMTSPVITILLVSLVLSLLLYPATAWLQKKGLSSPGLCRRSNCRCTTLYSPCAVSYHFLV